MVREFCFPSKKYKMIWVAIPKNASKSIVCELKRNDFFIASDCIDAIAINVYYPSYYKFTVIRNPYDRLVSAYTHCIVEENIYIPPNLEHVTSFESLVETLYKIPDYDLDMHFISQVTFIWNLNIDKVYNFDNLNELSELPCINTLPHINSSDRKPYKEYYTKKLTKLVNKRYKKDLELYNQIKHDSTSITM